MILTCCGMQVGELELTSPDKVRNMACTATMTVIGHEIRFADLEVLFPILLVPRQCLHFCVGFLHVVGL